MAETLRVPTTATAAPQVDPLAYAVYTLYKELSEAIESALVDLEVEQAVYELGLSNAGSDDPFVLGLYSVEYDHALHGND